MTDRQPILLHQESLREQIERIIGKDPRVLGTFEYRHILSEVHALEAENTKLKNECDSIAAKAFEMAAQAVERHAAGYPINLCNLASALRALSSASARRQVQLDLLRARLDEAKWRHMQRGHHGQNWCCERIAQLESEIAALASEKTAPEDSK